MNSLVVSNPAAKRLGRDLFWLSERDVVGLRPRIAGIANLLNKRRHFVGMAFLSPDSRYYLRVFSTTKAQVNRDFWRGRIRKAHKKRAALSNSTNAYRVIHAEADGIPSVVIDKYNDIWVIEITSSGARTVKNDLIDIIVSDYNAASVIEKDDGEGKIVFGSKSETVIREGDQKFGVAALSGQKTGAYLDYRAFRAKAREFARGKCLDAFCYQGWFSCWIANFVDKIVAVDSSPRAIEAAKKNAALNNHSNIGFVRDDVFAYLSNCNESFDFIHLDPPSFAKGAGQLHVAVPGYKKLIISALRLLNSGGVFMISSCSHAITQRILEETLVACIEKTGRSCEIIYRGIQDKDHPVLRGHPESLYLKVVAVVVSAK